MVFDTFTYFNEEKVLELRLNILDKVVDKFVIVESTRTFAGKDKPLNFNINKFEKFKDKIIYIISDDMPMNCDAWGREDHQRNAIIRGLGGAQDSDTIVLSDVDEIWNPDAIVTVEAGKYYRYEQTSHYFFFNTKNDGLWKYGPVVCKYGDFTRHQPCKIRHQKDCHVITNGGWHFSYIGGEDRVKLKIESFSHQELNNDAGKNLWLDKMRRIETTSVLDETFPKYLRDNIEDFRELTRDLA